MFNRPLHGPVPAQTATDIPQKEGSFKDTIKEFEDKEAEERGTSVGTGSSHYCCCHYLMKRRGSTTDTCVKTLLRPSKLGRKSISATCRTSRSQQIQVLVMGSREGKQEKSPWQETSVTPSPSTMVSNEDVCLPLPCSLFTLLLYWRQWEPTSTKESS